MSGGDMCYGERYSRAKGLGVLDVTALPFCTGWSDFSDKVTLVQTCIASFLCLLKWAIHMGIWEKAFLVEERAPTKAQRSCLLLIRKTILVGFIDSGLKLPWQLERGVGRWGLWLLVPFKGESDWKLSCSRRYWHWLLIRISQVPFSKSDIPVKVLIWLAPVLLVITEVTLLACPVWQACLLRGHLYLWRQVKQAERNKSLPCLAMGFMFCYLFKFL